MVIVSTPFVNYLSMKVGKTMAESIVLDTTLEEYRKYFSGACAEPPSGARWSAPDDTVRIVGMRGSDVADTEAVWGFVPQWRTYADNPAYYAAGASIHREWTLSVAFRNWRCIVPASSLVSLREVDGVMMCYKLSRTGGGLMLLGGIFEPNPRHVGAKAPTVALVTTVPNRMLAPHGLPVPLLLNRKQIMPWLRSRTNIDLVNDFIQPPGENSLKLAITVEPSVSTDNQEAVDLQFA